MDKENIANNVGGTPQGQVTETSPIPQEQPASQATSVSEPESQEQTSSVPQGQTASQVSTPPQAALQEQATPQTPVTSQAPSVPDSQEQKKPNGSWKIVAILGAVIVATVLVAISLVLLLNSKNGASVSLDSVRKYCEEKGLEINTPEFDSGDSEEDFKLGFISCRSKAVEESSYENGVFGADFMDISFGVAEDSLMNSQRLKEVRKQVEKSGTILAEDENYFKFYMKGMDVLHAYIIVSGNTYMQFVATDNELAKEALIAMGYPDSDWPTSDETGKMSAVQSSQRDLQRQDDMSRMDTALIQYQFNNADKLPAGPSYWGGSTELNCEESNEACKFVRDYMNTGSSTDRKTNKFLDPDETPYSVYISENWIENGTITTDFGNYDAYLTGTEKGFVIDGDSPFEQHIIYIINGGKCNEKNGVIKASAAEHFAIMYQLEDDTTYCIDTE